MQIHTQQEEGRGMGRENSLHHLGHSCPEVLCPKCRNQRMEIRCPLILSPRVEYLHRLDDSVFKIVLGFFFPLKMTLQVKHVFHPSLGREKRKEKSVICSMLGYSCLFFFFLTLFKPKPCVRCDFHVVIIFMTPMSYAASLHQTSFWILRVPQLGVEQSCA